MWIALSTSTAPFLALTPQVSAVLRAHAPGDGDGDGEDPADGAADKDASPETPGPGRAAIEAALAQARGSVTTAARRLGLKNRYALYRLIQRQGIVMADGEPGDG